MNGWAPVSSTPEDVKATLEDPWASESDKNKIYAELILGQMAALLIRRGDRDAAASLLDVQSATIEYDDEARTRDLWLEAAPEHFGQLKPREELFRDIATEIARRRDYPVEWLGVREGLPEVGLDWRTQLRTQIEGRQVTNQARRVRAAGPVYAEDGFAFTNVGELKVYRALKRIQDNDLPSQQTIGIFPLPGLKVPGHAWEPDLLVTYRGRAAVLEIDGSHHNGRRALDVTRDHLMREAGIAFVDRVPVEALESSSELMNVLRRFLRLLAEVR
jgi:hypothetical protein